MIRLKNISKGYPARSGGWVEVLHGVSLHVPKGMYLALVGPSGSGKSTLMHILGCLDTPTGGRYWLDGEDVSGMDAQTLCRVRREKIGFVFQGYQLMSRLTALENVAFPLMLRGMEAAQRRKMALQALERVGLLDQAQHLPPQLSGGQQQRVAIARALCAQPRLLLCDEPTAALDPDSRSGILSLLDDLHAEGHTIALITHDPFVAARAQQRMRMHGGVLSPA